MCIALFFKNLNFGLENHKSKSFPIIIVVNFSGNFSVTYCG